MKRILVTGGAGNVGGSLCKRLVLEPNVELLIVDNLITGSLSKLPSKEYSNWRFVKCDVNKYEDISSVWYSFMPDYVFHYAALVGVQRTLNNPIMVLDDIEGIKNILNLSKNTNVKRVFFSSSSEVYGEPVEFPQNEYTTPLNSRLPYAIVKNVAEAFLKSYKQEFDLNYTIFRFFNTYGPDQSSDFVMAKFIKLALENKDITIYGDGLQTRTFCYISDNIDATLQILNNDLVLNDVINLGNDIELTILALAQKVIALTGSKSKIIHLPALIEGDMTRRKPDNSKMKAILNKPLISIDEGIGKMINK
jgi:nucleoside-diphosphate-sugar epimerase